MSEYASWIGWLTVFFLFLALLNFPVKRIYRRWISSMAKNASFRKFYIKLQKIIVRYHRFFASAATLTLIVHLYLQLQYRWLSYTGLAAAILLVLNSFIGSFGHYVKKKKPAVWLIIHRSVAVLLISSIALHIYTGGR